MLFDAFSKHPAANASRALAVIRRSSQMTLRSSKQSTPTSPMSCWNASMLSFSSRGGRVELVIACGLQEDRLILQVFARHNKRKQLSQHLSSQFQAYLAVTLCGSRVWIIFCST